MLKRENKREVFRVGLPIDMCGKIAISKISDNKVNTRMSNVCISNISAVGVKFKSKLILPIEGITYNIYIRIFDKAYIFEGVIRWKEVNADGTFSYGLMFNQSEQEKEELIQIIMKLSQKVKYTNENIYRYCTTKCPSPEKKEEFNLLD